jgi:putative ABC transport system permease protein
MCVTGSASFASTPCSRWPPCSLALGIGANTAIFQLINAIRLRSLPEANPEELAYLDYAPKSPRGGWCSTRSATFTSANWQSIRQHQEAFSGIVAWSAHPFNLVAEGQARYAEGLFVSGDFFRVLGARASVGRVFTAADDRPGCGSPAAVIGYSVLLSSTAS